MSAALGTPERLEQDRTLIANPAHGYLPMKRYECDERGEVTRVQFGRIERDALRRIVLAGVVEGERVSMYYGNVNLLLEDGWTVD